MLTRTPTGLSVFDSFTQPFQTNIILVPRNRSWLFHYPDFWLHNCYLIQQQITSAANTAYKETQETQVPLCCQAIKIIGHLLMYLVSVKAIIFLFRHLVFLVSF